jgi:DNA-binding Xre family transcriptional regulator
MNGESILNNYSRSNFDDFLEAEGMLEGVAARAQKRFLALQIADIIQATALSKTRLAEKMNTDLAQLDRLLDPDNTSITLETLERLARAVGRQLRIEFA